MAAKKTAKPEQAGPYVVRIATRLDAARLDVDWLDDARRRAAVFLEIDPTRPAAPYLRLVIEHADITANAIKQGNAEAAAFAAAGAMCACWQAEIVETNERWFKLKVAPLAVSGEKFTTGRKPGTAGPVRLAIRMALKRAPLATAAKVSAAQVWEAIKAKPPKGMAFYDNPKLGGKYIETAGHPDTLWGRFNNLVSEEKKTK